MTLLQKYTPILQLVKEEIGMIPLFDILSNHYEESHRVYHNFDHIIDMVNRAENIGILSKDLIFAIIFHDIIYNLSSTTNEEDSAELMKLTFKGKINDVRLSTIYNAILSTKDHKAVSVLSQQIIDLDLAVLYGDFNTFVTANRKIFKEYQSTDFLKYQKEQVKILKRLNAGDVFVEYTETQKPNIAVYAGSFSPFHKGHMNILLKAEQIFDKVIIAKGVNPSKKGNDIYELPTKLANRQIEHYEGLLTDFIGGLGYDVTLIRGLRNATDLEEEKTQYRYLQDLKPDIKVINILCDTEYEHISSSAIRQLMKFNKHKEYLI